MPVTYYLQPNPVTPDPNDQSARVVTAGNLTADDLAAELVKRGNASSKAQAAGIINGFLDLVAEKVAEGFAVNNSLFTARPGINGVFTDLTDTFDAARHVLRGNLSPGPGLEEAMRTATTQKTTKAEPAPVILSFINKNTGGINATVTSGGIGLLVGEQLKFDPAVATAGIYFVPATGSAVKVTTIASRTEGELLFQVPTLAAGTWHIEVRRSYGTTNPVLRTGQLSAALTVA